MFMSVAKVITLSVMTFNIENGGTQISFDKVVEAIQKSHADVVGIQEAWGNIPRLANALGWKYYDKRQHVISRYPLYEDNHHVYDFVEVTPHRFVAIANVHLPDEPYGPDLIKSGKKPHDIEKNEKHVRLPTALNYVTKLTPFAKQGVPVFLVGDFNSPSHQDAPKISWPVTKALVNAGLTDSYRRIHPDFRKSPAYTWPSGRPIVANAIDGFNPSANDMPVRIDYIFFGGNARVVDSRVVGENEIAPWPSDHRAVVSVFKVKPAKMDVKKLVAVDMSSRLNPSVSVLNKTISVNEPFIIQWQNALGNRFDYISISPVNSAIVAYLYTGSAVNGMIEYNAQNVKGNFVAWNKCGECQWPLQPGEYSVRLMSDDSPAELAATRIQIKP